MSVAEIDRMIELNTRECLKAWAINRANDAIEYQHRILRLELQKKSVIS